MVNTMKRLTANSSSANKDTNNNPNQILVKTDKRFYWCTKCSKIYLNLISLYTESHYRQCVGEGQHFNVVQDAPFFAHDDIRAQLPSSAGNEPTHLDTQDVSAGTSRKKEPIFFSKTSDDSRTYFINGKSVRMSTVNRPITVKDLRHQFHQQSSVTTSNPSEEYIFQQQRSSTGKSANHRTSRSNEPTVKVIPTPRSFDRFGISSDDDEEQDDDDDDEEEEDSREQEKPKWDVKQPKPEIEKTLVKRRYDSDYASSTQAITSIGQDEVELRKPFVSRKSQPITSDRVRKRWVP